MNPLNLITFFSFLIMIFSCQNEVETKEESVQSSNSELQQEEKLADEDLSNPAIMLGSDLGNLFRSLNLIGDVDRMLLFTANAIKSEIGKEELKQIYRDLDLGMQMQLKGITKEDEFQVLNYEVSYRATQEARKLKVVVENDTAKIHPNNIIQGSVFE